MLHQLSKINPARLVSEEQFYKGRHPNGQQEEGIGHSMRLINGSAMLGTIEKLVNFSKVVNGSSDGHDVIDVPLQRLLQGRMSVHYIGNH